MSGRMTEQNSPSPTPIRAIYGFVIYLAAHLAFVIYLIWALTPDDWLRAAGITYYPNKHWAVTVPLILVLVYFLAYPIYMVIAIFKSAPLSSLDTITDNYAKSINDIPYIEGQITPIADLPITEVNKHLYSQQPSL